MRKFWLLCLLAALAEMATLGEAASAGGAGSAELLWQKNAICDAQRRGEKTDYPDMCLPELPVDGVSAERRRRQR